MKKNTKKWLTVILFSISLIAGIMFYILMSKPFGFLFNLSFYLLTGSLVLGLLLLTIICYKSSKLWLKLIGILPTLLGLILFILVLAVSIDIRMVYFMGIPPNPTKDEWKKDLHFLAEQMQKKYPNLYSKVSEDLFSKTVQNIEVSIPELSESNIVMELFRLAALPNDAHTIPFVFLPCFDLHDFPIKIYKFVDGWYIIDAAHAYSDLVGTKILKIGSTNIEDIFQKFPPFLAAENEYARLERFTYIALSPEWLKSQGIIDNLKEATLTLEKKNGEQIVETVDAVKFIYKFYWSFITTIDNRSSTAFLNPRKDWYWFEMLEDGRTIYFQFNEVNNQKGKETISEFSKRLNDYVNIHDFDRLIIDLRNNMGGNDIYLTNLMNVIRDNRKINSKNKLFVLTGRHTFSSAALFAYKLRSQTKAIFIGEPTAQGPVFGGNPAFVYLPNSKLVFAIATTSTARTQSAWNFKTENAIKPDIPVPYSHQDFLTGKDPVLEMAMNYHSPEHMPDTISETILDRYTGRFLLSTFQVLDVKRNGVSLSFCIDDFIPGNLFRVQSDLYAKSENDFETDLSNVSIFFPKTSGIVSSLIINWEGQKDTLNRAPSNYKLALELLAEKKVYEALNIIKGNKQEYSNLPIFENALNAAGYELLNQNKIEESIQVFILIVELFPGSFNAYDSLGEAYMKAGNKEHAIKNYEKSLELNPKNQNGEDILKRLKEN